MAFEADVRVTLAWHVLSILFFSIAEARVPVFFNTTFCTAFLRRFAFFTFDARSSAVL